MRGNKSPAEVPENMGISSRAISILCSSSALQLVPQGLSNEEDGGHAPASPLVTVPWPHLCPLKLAVWSRSFERWAAQETRSPEINPQGNVWVESFRGQLPAQSNCFNADISLGQALLVVIICANRLRLPENSGDGLRYRFRTCRWILLL